MSQKQQPIFRLTCWGKDLTFFLLYTKPVRTFWTLTKAALLSTPGQPVQDRSQNGVLQCLKTVLLLSKVMDHLLGFAPEHHLDPEQLLDDTKLITPYHMSDQTELTSSYSVALRLKGGSSNERVVSFH